MFNETKGTILMVTEYMKKFFKMKVSYTQVTLIVVVNSINDFKWRLLIVC